MKNGEQGVRPRRDMIEMVALLSMPLLGIVAWLLSARSADRVRRFAQALVYFAGAVWSTLVVTGIGWQPESLLATCHELLGHLLVLAVALATGVCAGCVVRREFRHQPLASVGWLVLFLFTWA